MATSVDDETILEVLRTSEAPRLTTTEISSELPVTRGTTRTRLQRLADDDRLERARESNDVVWWLPERADELDAAEATPANAAEDEAGGDGATPGGDNAAEAEEPTGDETEGEIEIAAEVDEPDDSTGPGGEEESADREESGGEEEGSSDEEDETTVEVEPTEQREPDATAVEVDAVESDVPDAALPAEDEPAADWTPEAESETRTAATAADDRDRTAPTPTGREPDLAPDDEGLRALALAAGALAAILLLRKFLGGSDGGADAE